MYYVHVQQWYHMKKLCILVLQLIRCPALKCWKCYDYHKWFSQPIRHIVVFMSTKFEKKKLLREFCWLETCTSRLKKNYQNCLKIARFYVAKEINCGEWSVRNTVTSSQVGIYFTNSLYHLLFLNRVYWKVIPCLLYTIDNQLHLSWQMSSYCSSIIKAMEQCN